MSFFAKLIALLDRRARVRAVALVILIVIGAVLEAGGAGLILPFISIVGQPELVQQHAILRRLYEVVGAGSTQEFLVWTAAGLLLFYVGKNVYIGWLIAAQNRFVYSTYVKQSNRLLRTYLSRPWAWHLHRNSAELLRNVNTDVLNVFGNVMVPLLTGLTELAVATAVLAVLVAVAPLAAFVVVALVGGASAAFYASTRKRLQTLGRSQQREAGEMIKWVNQALGGIKEAKVLGREAYFADRYGESIRSFAHATEYALTVNQLPRLFVETVAVAAMLLIVVVMLAQGSDGRTLLPVLGLFAMASFRLIPSVNRLVGSVTRMLYHRSALDVVHHDLEEAAEPGPDGKHGTGETPVVRLANAIELVEVSYQYPEAESPALRLVSLRIPRGRAVAVVGPSGAGKTTLADVILGLLPPTRGRVVVDGVDIHANIRSWQRQIGYVPQAIYLSDDSILRNIAFGVPDHLIDEGRVWETLDMVQLRPLVEELAAGLNSFVGERGVRLSGGQRQRIGIARALYNDPELLVMDEATSALDTETERAIAGAIQQLTGTKTLILIAHRPETIERCDPIVELERGELRACRTRS